MLFSLTWQGTATDTEVFAFSLEQTEGEFAELTITTRNPRQGLLTPGRALYCTLNLADYGPVFNGRVVAIPENVHEEVIEVRFIARPDGYKAAKEALAATMRDLPWFDPVWYTPENRGNPDLVLEARPRLWHVDRVSHVITASHILEGDVGTVPIDTGFFQDSLQISMAEPPVSHITCEAIVSWDQRKAGTINLTGNILRAFRDAGSPGGLVSSYTGAGLKEAWPKRGDSIGDVWTVGVSNVKREDGRAVRRMRLRVKTADGDVGFPKWTMRPTFNVKYDVSRSREETVRFAVSAGIQALINDPRDEEQLNLSLSSSEIDQPIDTGGAMPVADPARPRYFQTVRGQLSLRHLMLICRARLMARARAVEITFQLPLNGFTIGLSCRHSVRITDPRIPGTTAIGKVIRYRISLDGDSGQAMMELTIGCTVGLGGSVATGASAGPEFTTGYTGGYQVAQGTLHRLPDANGLGYYEFGHFPIDDDGIDLMSLSSANVVEVCAVKNGEGEQRRVMEAGPTPPDIEDIDPANPPATLPPGMFPDMQAAADWLNENHTVVAIALKPLSGGPFSSKFDLVTTPLVLPKTIDLGVPSNGS